MWLFNYFDKKHQWTGESDLHELNVEKNSLRIVHFETMTDINAAQWDGVFHNDNPFVSHAYLAALEQSAVVSVATGWQPYHIGVYFDEAGSVNEQDCVRSQPTISNVDVNLKQGSAEQGKQGCVKPKLIALMPLYIKTHSWGEYVFDWAWAEAYERNGLAYYPKLVTAIPFTPTVGPRVGHHASLSTASISTINQLIHEQIKQQCQTRFSSWHQLFLPQSQLLTTDKDIFCRIGTQFHWQNKGYQQFDDFLKLMTSRKRKEIKKARLKIHAQGLSFTFVHGQQMTSDLWQCFYACYQQTYLKRSGHNGYLNQTFFEMLGRSMGAKLRVLVVKDSSENVLAMALYFQSATHLYGRYWGALADIDGLHFEACYYQGIEYAIEHKLTVFDAGAQGEHKVPRGFEPVSTFSQHHVAHQGFCDAIKAYCNQEAQHMDIYQQQMQQQLPFKQNTSGKTA
ncbi:GNAT family N-acetyltransferase [Shewanella intestini]|uniref:GNAT family N-acetyltransferase n=1 Tax=Shewanella intestini TaxID=2017544 RepID=A0ABS5HZ78_9GAMM|nr:MULTISPECIES: GNAT family N-acetyltransferase [Shewanella]MBR9727047.1 GNAT family N-acetyltransferase [Shewanella intestini]MRG35848.1 GNAT family N-acetyltransferase [Shewanella sp. XMDDZSB0408]